MEDIQKIKEFFSKPMKEGNEEYFKPVARKDKSNPNFLYVDIAYPEGSGVLSVGGSKTMSGQDREAGAVKALAMGNAIVKKLEAKYNIEDIEVKDLKNGKVQVFAVSDDFTKMASPSLNEAWFPMVIKKENEYPKVRLKKATEYGWKPEYYVVGEYDNDTYILVDGRRFYDWEKSYQNKKPGFNKYEEIVSKSEMENSMNEAKKETAVDMAKKQLDALGVKYEMSTTDKVRPFKVIYQPINKSDKFYDTFEDIVDLFNLKGVVKSSMSEAPQTKYSVKPGKKGFSVIKTSTGSEITSFDTEEKAKQHTEKLNKMKFIPKEKFNEAKEEDAVDTITMDIPLFIRMLEYSREDAAEDMDLHDVTEKAISLGKERGILQMDDYDEIIGTTKEIEENVAPNHNGKAAPYGSGYKPLEERIAKALDSINEELCPAGKAYRKRRMAAGEKSSAYLSGRAVKVCKGQMSGKKKKK